jgi:transposase
MDVINPVCAGLDVHKAKVSVCLRRMLAGARKPEKTVRTYRTTTRELSTLVRWLADEGVTHVAMESTGVYWKPIYNIFEEHGRFTLLLCNAQHVKQVPGRKTDVKDCEWLAQLLQHGLLKGSFIPPKPVRELRDLTRLRTKFIEQRSTALNRIQKILEDANIKLSSVATDIWGASGQAMIQGIIEGESSPTQLASLAVGRLRTKTRDLEAALEGRVKDHHRFQLRILVQQLGELENHITVLDERIKGVMEAESKKVAPAPAEAGELFATLGEGKEVGGPVPFVERCDS